MTPRKPCPKEARKRSLLRKETTRGKWSYSLTGKEREKVPVTLARRNCTAYKGQYCAGLFTINLSIP